MEHTSVPAAFPERHVLEGRFQKFLEERGLDLGDVIGETDQGHGRPALAVAAGSVLAGFGNHRSDLDLLVLVENDQLTRFPIQSHRHGTLIDVNIRQASAVLDRTARLRDSFWPRFDTVTQEAWNHRRRTLKTMRQARSRPAPARHRAVADLARRPAAALARAGGRTVVDG